jgi:N-acetylneuraminic acid mutarotase
MCSEKGGTVASRLLPTVLVWVVLFAPATLAREITFEQRVDAQEAIERVYYSHLDGATATFEEAVPRSVIEDAVRRYLRQSVALERFWETPVTGTMLRREAERMARGTRLPERLREIHEALGNDPFLIQECLVRPIVVDRLTRNFFAYDGSIHAGSAARAASLHSRLLADEIDVGLERPGRTVAILTRATGARTEAGEPILELDAAAFDRMRQRLPKRVGEVGPLVEGRERFTTRVLLEESEAEVRVATYAVGKRTWDDWWTTVRRGLDPLSVNPSASSDDTLSDLDGGSPERERVAVPCLPDDTWAAGVLDQLPDGRHFHTAVWTGAEMIVWGGFDSSAALGTGSRYDPATDTWSSTSRTNAPSARYHHAAVWSDGEMIVWGGFDGTYLDDGARYDPATDTWNPISTVDAPSARHTHTAVWADTEMIVWGGFDGTYLDDGARYDPSGNSWTALPALDTPGGRSRHTAVWTDTEMIVWGGFNGTYLSTGGRYDPLANDWEATTTTGVPQGRYHHTAVWIGGEMIVWGGFNFNYVDTGGRYDPVDDRWTSTTTTGAPASRSEHTAVAAGTEMIVWGGRNATILDTGAIYDPGGNSWTALPVAAQCDVDLPRERRPL